MKDKTRLGDWCRKKKCWWEMIPGGSIKLIPRNLTSHFSRVTLRESMKEHCLSALALDLLPPCGDSGGGAPSLPPTKINPLRPGFPSCSPKLEELGSFSGNEDVHHTMICQLHSGRNLVRGQTCQLWPTTTEAERISHPATFQRLGDSVSTKRAPANGKTPFL